MYLCHSMEDGGPTEISSPCIVNHGSRVRKRIITKNARLPEPLSVCSISDDVPSDVIGCQSLAIAICQGIYIRNIATKGSKNWNRPSTKKLLTYSNLRDVLINQRFPNTSRFTGRETTKTIVACTQRYVVSPGNSPSVITSCSSAKWKTQRPVKETEYTDQLLALPGSCLGYCGWWYVCDTAWNL